MKSKRIIIARKGGPDVLQIVEDDLPEPQSGEVRVKILAAGVAFAEVMMRYGMYPGAPSMPFTPGWDLAGVVDRLGAGVTALKEGQKVVALTGFGSYAQYRNIAAQELVPVPDKVDAAEAVAVALSYVTASQMLHRFAHAESGERILVHAAAGGVGTAILQLGKLAGLEMYGTASKGKHEIVSTLGATPIDYRTEDFVERIRSLTSDGVDIVLDAIGGDTTTRSFRTLRKGGRLMAYGFTSFAGKGNPIPKILAQFLRIGLWQVLPNGRKAKFYSIQGTEKKHPGWIREDLAKMVALLAEGKINPIIAERIPLAEASRAHELIEGGTTQGKLVLICD